MSCVYVRGKSLWIAYKDERGLRVCRPSGYKVGDEAAAEAVAVELDRKAKAAHGTRPTGLPGPQGHCVDAPPTIPAGTSTSVDRRSVLAGADPQPLPLVDLAPSTGPLAVTVREYGERWIKTRDHVETVADEIGRLRNHVFPALGDLKMREVRPRHIRDFIKDLKKANSQSFRSHSRIGGPRKSCPRVTKAPSGGEPLCRTAAHNSR